MLSSLFLSVFVFILGLVVGSFLNCFIYRLEKGRSFLKGRSFCPSCHHTLGFLDLMPVLSFFLLRGRCRYCQKNISWQYPLVETATGVLFLLVFLFHLQFFIYLVVPFLVAIFVYDFKHCLIPDQLIYPAVLVAAVFNPANWLSALGAASFFLAIVLVSKEQWMGLGDVKLAFLMGFLLGWPGVGVALFLAFMSGAIIGIGLIARKKKTLKSEVPFGPFLVFGTLASLFWGQSLINWYFNFL